MPICNCFCDRCANNVDTIYSRKGSTKECFDCEQCKYYDFDKNKKLNIKSKCKNFVLAEDYIKYGIKILK
ncbi:MAG: hypothetical protein KIC67_14815 [Clostridium butyricum]|nr:hypothetical protein [Clostridium butyricum]